MNHVSRADPITRARDLGPAIETAAATIEQTQIIGEPLLTLLHDARLLRLLLPRSFGGEEVEPWVYLRTVEEVSRHDASVGWNLFVANSSALIAPFMEPETAHAIYDDPRALISWGPPNAARAKAVPGGYRITGEWEFSSGCRQATWMGAHAQVEEPDGSLRLNAAGTPLTRTLLFPVAQANLIHRWNVIGLRGTASDAYSVSDLFVPEAFSATREQPDARREPGRLYAFTMQGLYAVGHSGVVKLGVQHRCQWCSRRRMANASEPRRTPPWTSGFGRTWPGPPSAPHPLHVLGRRHRRAPLRQGR
jgi:alkylation response protein AidB-like acyl-CoA dehydrogenase